MNDLIFVYGTLRRGYDSNMSRWFSRHSVYAEKAFYQGRLFMMNGYPGVVPSENPDHRIVGDLCQMHDPEPTLRMLDQYEGLGQQFNPPTEYIRSEVSIIRENGTTCLSWIYLYNLPVTDFTEIKSGDFLETGHQI